MKSRRKTSLFKLMSMLLKLGLKSADEWYWTVDEQYMHQPFLERMNKDNFLLLETEREEKECAVFGLMHILSKFDLKSVDEWYDDELPYTNLSIYLDRFIDRERSKDTP